MTPPGAIQSIGLVLLLTSDELESYAYSLVVALIGLALVYYGYHRHRQRGLMRDTPTSEVESAAVGAVELVGTAEPAEATVSAPLSGEECVVVDYEVEEYKRHDDLTKEWVTVDSAVVAEPFYVNDGTGRMLVDASERSSHYDVSEENRAEEEYEATGAQPGAVDGFLVEHADVPPHVDHPRRYTQAVIPVGAEAYVFGDVETAADAGPPVEPGSKLVVTRDEDTEMFLVSDKTEGELASDRRYSLVLWGLVGIAVFSAGLWWFLSTLGV